MTMALRSTGNTRTALDRLEAVTGSEAPKRGSLGHRLSVLAHTFMHGPRAATIREQVKYKPSRIPMKGMSGWQLDALERLTLTYGTEPKPARRARRSR